MDAEWAMILIMNLVAWGLVGVGAALVGVETARAARRSGRPGPHPPSLTKAASKAPGAIEAGGLSYWRWQTAVTYLAVLWVEYGSLTKVGMDPHTHPLLFVLFGLTLGLVLALLEWRRAAVHGPKGRE